MPTPVRPSQSHPGRRPPRSGSRLTGGEAAGRRLATLGGADLRATSSLVRAACFNILGEEVGGAQVADLFAGTGSLGLEALSRGAAGATFVELRRERCQLIRENLEGLGFGERGEVVTADALAWLTRSGDRLGDFRLVLMDPPYRDRGPALALSALEQLGDACARLGGWDPVVVWEHQAQLLVPAEAGALHCVRSARYGGSVLSLYRRLA